MCSLSLLPALRSAALAVALTLGVGGAIADSRADVGPQPQTASTEARAAADQAWQIVRDHFYDPAAVGPSWEAARQAHLDTLAGDATPSEVSAAVNAMLNTLDTSHTRHYTPSEPAYYALFDIFRRLLRDEVGHVFPGGQVSYVGIGVNTQEIDGRTFIIGVHRGGPADAAGVLLGDELIAVDGEPFTPIDVFQDRRGQAVPLTIRRSRDGEPIELTVVPRRILPNDAYADAMRGSARMHDRGGRSIGSIRVWSYAGRQYHDILIEELSEGSLAEADALVLDLRGGWGGARLDYAELFLGGAPVLTMTNRDGEQRVSPFRWRRPFVVLIDEGTRSGKELLAYAFQQHGVPLVGTHTAGAVVAGRPFLLSDHSLLYVAVMDGHVDGVRLEGTGVAPDIEVPVDIRYAAGRDVQLEAAVEAAARLLAEGQ